MIQRPRFALIPLSAGLHWTGGGGFIYEEKLDGLWHVRTIGRSVLVGELMPDGDFFSFDVVQYNGTDLRALPLRQRLSLLDDLHRGELRDAFKRVPAGSGGEFLETVLARGGEGVVAKHLDEPFGELWFKCKRQETFDLIVTEKHQGGKSSIRLAWPDASDAGWCPCRAEFDRVNVGCVVEVSAYGRTNAGKLREPRFVRRRPDKVQAIA